MSDTGSDTPHATTAERLAMVDGLVWRRYVSDDGTLGVLHMSHREWLRPSNVSPQAACVAWYPDGAAVPEVLWWTEAKALGVPGDGIRLSHCGVGRNFYRASVEPSVSPPATVGGSHG